MARQNRLDDVEFAKLVAELWVRGVGRDEMAAELDCHKDTISGWVRDPRVRAHVRTQARERVDRISRKIDGEMERRLAFIEDWDTEVVLKVRKEYLDRPLKLAEDGGASEAGATNELAEAMDSNPELASDLLKLLDGAKAAKCKKALPAGE